MKKLILLLTAMFTLACASLAFAAGDGTDLNRQQRAAESFIASFGSTAPEYTAVAAGFDGTLSVKVNEESYGVLKQQVRERFGRLQESKFYSFQRYDNVDYVTYIASFSRENLVNITLAFNKENKMLDFALSPIQQQEQQQEQNTAQQPQN